MSDTPRTDKLARGNHVVPTEWAEDLERECNQLRKDLKDSQTAHACIARLPGLVRQVANPLETLMGIPARLQQAWQCPECGKTEWKDVPIVTVEEAAK